MRLDGHQFHQSFLSGLLLPFVKVDHDFQFSLEYLAEELAACFSHIDNFQSLKAPVINSGWEISDTLFELEA